mmetsp:Transcript_72547/g.144101  ORF Transcript_72547/g.144101 Transcript_72547/m.144101 type:complete len:84 (-) Transcript_72547:158-409(-)
MVELYGHTVLGKEQPPCSTPPCLLYSKANRCSIYVSGDLSLGMCYDLLYIILPGHKLVCFVQHVLVAHAAPRRAKCCAKQRPA